MGSMMTRTGVRHKGVPTSITLDALSTPLVIPVVAVEVETEAVTFNLRACLEEAVSSI
jgi:hypothetical protein